MEDTGMSESTGRKILVKIPFTEEQKKKISAAADGVEVIYKKAEELTEQDVAEAEVIMGNLPKEKIQAARNLKWLQLNSAGADLYCQPGVLKDSVALTNASGAYDISVSEYMISATLALMKKLYPYHVNQQNHQWKDEGGVMAAQGACILVLGLGNIGLRYARVMKAMGSYIIGIRRHAGTVPEEVDELHTMADLEECLKRADIVAAVLPGTPQTLHLLGREQFAAMKRSAYLINAGRGNSVDPDALYDALEQGKIAGAVLDVMEQEPLPADHRLWNARNLYLTPHVAGGFHIPVTLDLIAEICADNLKRYLAGEALTHVVNRELGY